MFVVLMTSIASRAHHLLRATPTTYLLDWIRNIDHLNLLWFTTMLRAD